MTVRTGHIVAFAVFLCIGGWSYLLAEVPEGRTLSFSLLAGASFGIVLQRGRFCFLCNFRDLIDGKRSDGVIAILVALAAGIVLYQIVVMAWVPIPQEGRLPPTAHIGPVGYVLAIASVVFGLGMALSGSCLSAHFYRLGEGSFGSLAAILGAGFGFFFGFLSWNWLYVTSIFDDPSIWLPYYLGYGGSLVAAFAILLVLAGLVLWRGKWQPVGRAATDVPRSVANAIFIDRWPPVVTGLLVAIVSAFTYFRAAPLGVTAELGSLVRTAALDARLVPETLAGLDTVRGCISAVKTTILSPNGLFVIGIISASLASALIAGQFKASWPSSKAVAARFLGGVMMGWGGMTALGCTVGVLLSGIHAGALSGWVFLFFCALGTWSGLKVFKGHIS